MANLILKEFRCVEETDEVGSDSPYFVIFVGQRGNAPISDVKTIRKDSWDNNIGSGDFRAPNITVAAGVDTSTLVIVALMEEDANPDITGGDLANVQNWMKSVFQAFGSVGGTSLTQLAAQVKPEFIKALNANITNDEIVNVQRLTITTLSGSLPLVHFFGDGGHYRVRFRMT
jgi:hypothetical protein